MESGVCHIEYIVGLICVGIPRDVLGPWSLDLGPWTLDLCFGGIQLWLLLYVV